VTDDEAPGTDQLLGRFGVPPDAEKLWRALMAGPHASVGELTSRTGLSVTEVDAATQVLLAARLVQRSAKPAGVVAIDPALAIESHIGHEERTLLDGLQELTALRAEIPAFVSDYARGRRAAGDEAGVEIIVALDDVRHQIYQASQRVKADVRSLYHTSTVESFRDSQPSEVEMLGRGVRSRSIIGAQELNDPEIYAELEKQHTRGDSFRALPEIPTRMLIYDRELAILRVEATTPQRGAIFVRVSTLIDMLVLLFDHMWSVADPVFTESNDLGAPAGRRARVLELMAIGTKDERIARTLGIGARTIRRDIADLKTTLGVSSRAEIVAAAVRKGWL
jgi:DNA-binding CsgD family transcriptional regulator